MRIGLFGGTFDPIHIGHLIIAETVRDVLKMDKIIFIPAVNPPHKQGKLITSSVHRIAMIRLAIANHADFQLSEIEVVREGISYTFDTIKIFQELYPAGEMVFLMGADSLRELHTWHKPEQLVKMIKTVVFPRPSVDLDQVDPFFFDHIDFINAPLIGISSSEIRQNVRSERSIRYLVPDSVAEYIQENRLYNKC